MAMVPPLTDYTASPICIVVLIASSFLLDALLLLVHKAIDSFVCVIGAVGITVCFFYNFVKLMQFTEPLPGQYKYLYNRMCYAGVELLFYCVVLCDHLSPDVLCAYGFTMFISLVHFMVDLHLEEWYIRPKLTPHDRRNRMCWLLTTCMVIDWLLVLRPEYIAGMGNYNLRQIMSYEYLNLLAIGITNMLKRLSTSADLRESRNWYIHTEVTIQRSLLLDSVAFSVHLAYYGFMLLLNPLSGLMVARLHRMTLRVHHSWQHLHMIKHSSKLHWKTLRLPSVSRRARVGLLCSICQMRLFVWEDSKFLPCGHAYHADCLHPWLQRIERCPNCMRPTVGLKKGRPTLPYSEKFRMPISLQRIAEHNEGRYVDKALVWHLFKVRYASDYFAHDGAYLYLHLYRNYGLMVLGGMWAKPLRKSALAVHYRDLLHIGALSENNLIPPMFVELKRFVHVLYDRLGFNGVGRLANALQEELAEGDSDAEDWQDVEGQGDSDNEERRAAAVAVDEWWEGEDEEDDGFHDGDNSTDEEPLPANGNAEGNQVAVDQPPRVFIVAEHFNPN